MLTIKSIRRAPWKPLLVVALAWVVTSAINLWVIQRYRVGFPIDIDESGYLGFSFQYWDAFRSDGFEGLWSVLQVPNPYAPLVPLATLPIHAVAGQGIYSSMAVQAGFVGVLGVAIYATVRGALANHWWAALAAALAMSTPMIMDYSRTYHFVVASTAMFAVCLACLVRSDALARTWPTILGGIATGLLLMSRTMTIAFVPALFAAIILLVLMAGISRRRLLHVVLFTFAAVLVASTWYWHSGDAIWNYLTGYGYGDESATYGPRHEPDMVRFWTRTMVRLAQAIYLPLVLVSMFASSLLAFAIMKRHVRLHRGGRTTQASLALCIAFAMVWIALTSSRNAGTGFVAPLVVPTIALIVIATAKVPYHRSRVLLTVALVAIVPFTLLSKASVWESISRERSFVALQTEAPSADGTRMVDTSISIPITDGAGFNIGYEGSPTIDGLDTMPPQDRLWLDASRDLARAVDAISRERGRLPVVSMNARKPFLNYNTLRLSWNMEFGTSLLAGAIDPRRDSIRYDLRALTDPAFGQPNMIIYSDRVRSDYPPHLDIGDLRAALDELGFEYERAMELPDGSTAHLYWLDRGPLRTPEDAHRTAAGAS